MEPPLPPTYIDAAAARFRLLGEPVRLRLLNALLDQGEASVQELAEVTGQSQQNTSKHLRTLAEGGLVDCRREGPFAYYRVTDPTIPALCILVCGQLQRTAARSVSAAPSDI